MPYQIHRSVDIHFAHHIRGHQGSCIHIHGHTWKFEVGLSADKLDAQGFVVDFSDLSQRVLRPCHALLDHALAIGRETYGEVRADLASLGTKLLATRAETEPSQTRSKALNGAENQFPGGLKVAVFPFSPTSERFARWLYDLARHECETDRVRVRFARVYETLHPVESVAEFAPGP